MPSLAFLLLLIPLTAPAQRQERIVDTWKPLHYDVNITFNNQLTEISTAKTEITAIVLKDGVKTIDLDFGAMPIDSVKLDGGPTHYDRQPDLLNVALPHPFKNGEKVNIAVNYHGRPTDGLVFATDRDGKPSVTGDNWPNRVHQWIPCLDHPSAKATVSFTVTVPQRDAVVANGKFINITRNAATSYWRYAEEKAIPPYCMVIVVNEGARVDATEPTVTPLSYHVPQRDRSYATKGFSPAAPALALFSETVAPYPYEKLGLIIGATKYGGMENSSAIVFTSTLFDQHPGEPMSARFGIPTRIESVVAHEIAHQWFGDSVTESTWGDLWLSEGFATYFAGLFIEKYDGEEAFRAYMSSAAERYFVYENQHRGPIRDTETLDLNQLLNPNNYEKGAWVLHMLRKRLGDDAFFKGLREYYRAHHEANATTEDLRAALEKASRQNLREFFARWVYASGHPKYEFSWSWKNEPEKGGALTISLQQTQPGDVFLDPVPVVIDLNGDARHELIKPTGKSTSQQFSLVSRPQSVQIDPDETILKEVIAKP
ncbi:MAG TPA: M1 family metallopeptidase [Pyrinomonadaceae bacterium]|nr:M1 family metallopeptidase [Pyrinomonadaceae bacterium]